MQESDTKKEQSGEEILAQLNELALSDSPFAISEMEALLMGSVDEIAKANRDLDDVFVPAFYCARPEFIQVVEKPGAKVRKIPTAQFEKEKRVTWSASPWMHRARKLTLHRDNDLATDDSNIIYEHLYFRQPDVAISYKNKDRVGCGLVANQDFRAGELVIMYSGLITSAKSCQDEFKPYGFICSAQFHQQTGYVKYYGKAFYDAEKIQGYSASIQHAPNNRSVAKLQVSEEARKWIVTSNLKGACKDHLNIPNIMFFASRDIKKGEELYYDYEEYWNSARRLGYSDGSYALFDLNSNILGTAQCDGRVELDPAYDVQLAKAAPRANDDMDLSYHDAYDVSLNKKCDKYLRENVKHVLLHFRGSLSKHAKLFKNIDRCLEKKDPIIMYNKIIGVLTEYQVEKIPELELFRTELFLYLNRFKIYNDFNMQAKSKTQSNFGYQLNQQAQAAVEGIKKALFDLTQVQWRFHTKTQVYYVSGDQPTLSRIHEVFSKQVKAKEFGADKIGAYFLVYEAKDISLDLLSKMDPGAFRPQVEVTQVVDASPPN